jgi:hypothetical protein
MILYDAVKWCGFYQRWMYSAKAIPLLPSPNPEVFLMNAHIF